MRERYSTGPSGLYLDTLFKRMGIADNVKGKLIQTPPGVPVGRLVADGKAEIGFQQVSELIQFPEVTFIGPLPREIQNDTQFSGGLHSASKEADAVKSFFRFLLSPNAARAIQHMGMHPG